MYSRRCTMTACAPFWAMAAGVDTSSPHNTQALCIFGIASSLQLAHTQGPSCGGTPSATNVTRGTELARRRQLQGLMRSLFFPRISSEECHDVHVIPGESYQAFPLEFHIPHVPLQLLHLDLVAVARNQE